MYFTVFIQFSFEISYNFFENVKKLLEILEISLHLYTFVVISKMSKQQNIFEFQYT